jgi:hypothetical protein
MIAALALGLIGAACAPPPPPEPKPKSEAQKRLERRVVSNIVAMGEVQTNMEMADSAMQDLMKIGGPAVPQLIDALNDDMHARRSGAYLVLSHIAHFDYNVPESEIVPYNADWPEDRRMAAQQSFRIWWQQTAGTVPEIEAPAKKETDDE